MKSFIIATLVQISATVLVSVALLLLVPGRRLEMLIIGQTLPASIIGLYFLIRIFLQEGRPKKVMLTNAVKLGIPMIPHTLGGVLLDRSDRVMITNLVGEAQTAYYSVGANVSTILIVVSNSLNNAFIPWLTGSLSKGEQDEEIKKNANRQILLFSVVVVAVLLLAPEIVFFFGGRNYQSSVAVMVPLLLGAYFHHVYVMYMNLEYYNRRTRGTVISTTIVAVLNIVLNYMFIPRYGFAAAAYTTLFCYVVRYFLHVGIAKRINMDHVYDNRKILIISLILLLSGFLFSFLYTQNIIRYLVIAVAAVAVVFLMIKNKEIIKAIFSREK
jgi:O-antigen/teichoic acid export membrane protein